MMKYISLIILSVLLWSVQVDAQTWYVNDATGHDINNDCTEAQSPSTPKKTITNALDECFTYGLGEAANKILQIAAGTYDENIVRDSNFPRGSSMNAPFTMQAAPGAVVTIRPTGPTEVFYVNNFGGDAFNAVIRGITFDGSGRPSWTESANVIAYAHPAALNMRFTGNRFTGNNLCDTNTFMSNGTGLVFDNNTLDSPWAGDPGDCGGYPIYQGGNGAMFEENDVFGFPRFGIHLYQLNGCPSGSTIRNNFWHDSAGLSGQPDAAILACGDNHKIYNNIVWNTPAGIETYDASDGNEVYNNSMYNTRDFCLASKAASPLNIFRNNICSNPGGAATYGNILDWNDAPQTYSNNICGQAGRGCSIVADPRYVDPGNGDFRLCIGTGNPHANCGSTPSPAIDAGTTVALVTTDIIGTSRPQPSGGSYDIGAFESGESGSNPPPDPINVVKMSFDEGTGQPQDVSGNANHGTLGTGVTWTTVGCKYNGCLSFAGTGGVTIADSASIDTITHGFTLSAWVKPTSVTNDSVAIVRNPGSKFFLFSSLDGVCGDNRPVAGHGQGGGTFACQAPSIQTGVWSHLTATYNGSQVILYINGASVASVASTAVLDPTDGTLQIGTSGFNEHFIGLMDEIFVDNYALSQAAIQTRMNTPINDPNPPVAGAYGRTGADAVRKTGAGAVAKTQGAIVE